MKWVKRFLSLFLAGTVAAALLVWGAVAHYSRDLPTLNGLADYHPSLTTRVYARDYQLMGEFFVERRQFVPRDEVPDDLVRAFLAIEDSKFYQHFGIDLVGIARAAVANLLAGRVVQGASTITQQVAKTFLLSSERTMDRKVKEIILSLRIEQRFSKDEILELYLNQIYLGAGAYGVGAASRIYFNKDVSELSIGQMALLAGLPKAPSKYDPWRFPERARKRQALVLQRMVETGVIGVAQAEAARQAPFQLARPLKPLERVAPHYLEHVRRSIHEEWGYRQLYRGGLDVYTTLSPPMQRAAQEAVRNGLRDYDRRHGYRGPLDALADLSPTALAAWRREHADEAVTVSGYHKGVVTTLEGSGEGQTARVALVSGEEALLALPGVRWARAQTRDLQLGHRIQRVGEVVAPGQVILLEQVREEGEEPWWRIAQEPAAEAALVCLDPHTGQILAMVGGYDFDRSEYNRAVQGKRQPGSSFKPFIYAAALDSGLTPVSRIDDSPIPITYLDPDTGERKLWRAENYEQKFYGPTTLRKALEHSRNLVTIRLLKEVGVSTVVPYVARFGLEIPTYRQDLSIALGTVGFTPLEMARAYAVFPNGGKLVKPVYIARVQDRYGRTVQRHGGGDCLLCHREPERMLADAASPTREAPLFGRRAISEETAYQMVNLLKGVVEHGTGRKALKLNRPLGGKTGTTNDLKDAWFMGFSPSLVTAVWVGNDDATTLGKRETGSRAALPIWVEFMGAALADQPVVDFPVPNGIHLLAVDGDTGTAVGPDSKRTVLEAFKADQLPELEPAPGEGGPVMVKPSGGELMDGGLY